MYTLTIVLLVLQLLSCVALTTMILLQSGKEDGLSALTGNSNSFMGRNKAATLDAKLARLTKWVAAVFVLLTFFVSVLCTNYLG